MPISTAPRLMNDSARHSPVSPAMSSRNTFSTETTTSAAEAIRAVLEPRT